MKILLLSTLMCASSLIHAQSITTDEKVELQGDKEDLISMRNVATHDTVVVHHTHYTSVFVTVEHIPYYVSYKLTKNMLTCTGAVHRTDDFKADPSLPGTNLKRDYAASGYDQGHNMSAEDNKCDIAGMHECFYYTNMFPQTPRLNRGSWKQLEVQERTQAIADDSIQVYIGSVSISKHIGPDNVAVPDFCWKLILDYKTGELSAYIFPNNDDVAGEPDKFKVGLDDFYRITGCDVLKAQ